jgi:hypothetical protein
MIKRDGKTSAVDPVELTLKVPGLSGYKAGETINDSIVANDLSGIAFIYKVMKR